MSSTPSPAPTRTGAGPALAALFLATFAMGSAELVVVGLVDLLSDDLDVSVSTSGTVVTAYALGICLGGPLLTACTVRWRRRTVLRAALGGYTVVNLLAALAPGFGVLLGARVVTGALQGLFLGAAFTLATRLVPAERAGRAISAVFGGIAVSTALGLPLGTLVGQHLGWRATFAAIVVASGMAFLALLLLVPDAAGRGGGGLAIQAPYAFAPRVLAVLAVGLLLLGGQFAALTYVTPFLTQVTGVGGGAVSAYLLAYGLATAVGTFAGGRAADRDATGALVLASAVLVLALGVLHLAGASPVVAAAALAAWGLVGFGLVPSLQYRVAALAGPGRELAATLPAAAVNAGIAAGALFGGTAVARGGPSDAVLLGLLICAVALPATWATRFLRPPRTGAAPAWPTARASAERRS